MGMKCGKELFLSRARCLSKKLKGGVKPSRFLRRLANKIEEAPKGQRRYAIFFGLRWWCYKKKGAVSTAPFDVAISLSGDT